MHVLDLQVCTLGGPLCDFPNFLVEAYTTVGDIKEMIERETRISLGQQCLLLGSRILRDNTAMEEVLFDDPDLLVLTLIRRNPKFLTALEYVREHGDFKEVPDEIRSRDFYYEAVMSSAACLPHLPEEFRDGRDGREFVLAAVTADGHALRWARGYRADPSVVLAAVSQTCTALEFASDELRRDWAIVLRAVSQPRATRRDPCSCALQFASEDLRRDREVVAAAVRASPYELQGACDDLRGDWELVMDAVMECGLALQFADLNLKNDMGIVLAAVSNCGEALAFASFELRDDKWVALHAVRGCGLALRFATGRLRDDDDVVLTAMKRDGMASLHASPRLMRKIGQHLAAGSDGSVT